jgi:hypothetical protein
MKVAHQLWHNEYSNEICSPIMAMTKKVTTNELFGLPYEKMTRFKTYSKMH